jgi:hypothetical protein
MAAQQFHGERGRGSEGEPFGHQAGQCSGDRGQARPGEAQAVDDRETGQGRPGDNPRNEHQPGAAPVSDGGAHGPPAGLMMFVVFMWPISYPVGRAKPAGA